jgi:mannose-6-phosphate isomerase-like protein (cupin superfamily)
MAEATVVAGEQEARLEPGAIVCVRAGESRGLKATTRLVALHVVAPPPTDADHAEVRRRIEQGVWP